MKHECGETKAKSHIFGASKIKAKNRNTYSSSTAKTTPMKKFFFLLLTFHFSVINVFGQIAYRQALVDSLVAKLPAAIGDTNHVNLFIDLSYAYVTIIPDEALNYGTQGLELAEKLE